MNTSTSEMQAVAEEASALLKAFAHPARLMICCQLRDREMSVGEIEETLDIRQPRLSRELAKLRDEGLVETRREAKSIHYRLSDKSRAASMVDALCAVMLGQPTQTSTLAEASPPAARNPTDGAGQFARIVRQKEGN